MMPATVLSLARGHLARRLHRSGRPERSERPERPGRHRGDAGQQAIILVLGILTLMSAMSVVIMTQTAQETPIIDKTLLDHAAYQALRAGVDDYLYAINADPNAAACSSGNPASCHEFVQSGFTFGAWNLVSRGVASNALHQWFAFGSPTLTEGSPPPHATPGTVDVTVVGAAGYLVNLKAIQYQTAHIIIDPQDDLLLNVVWSNITATDPHLARIGSGQTCRYYYLGDPCNSNGGSAVFDGSSFSVFGPLFSNDNVFVCNDPQMDYLTSGLPPADYGARGSNYGVFAAPGCNNHVAWGASGGSNCQFCVDKGSPERTPLSDANLAALAKLDGCYYSGPTTITFNSDGSYAVNSPETAATTGNTTFDPFSSSLNKSVCFPSGTSNSGTVKALPDNGVIYVDGAPSATCTSLSPGTNSLYAEYRVGTYSQYDGETSTPQCEGDAIVHGTVHGDVTVGVNNDIIIDGNIEYSSCMPASPVVSSAGQWSGSCTASSGHLNDVLGLVANNYVEVGLPVSQRFSSPSPSYCSAGISCILKNPVIEAAILTLNQTFGVTNLGTTSQQTSTVGNIAFLGSLAEQYSDIEQIGTWSGNLGYGMDYNWDQRLSVVAPPDFLSPLGSNFWAEQSSSVTVGTCSLTWPANQSTCPTSTFPAT